MFNFYGVRNYFHPLENFSKSRLWKKVRGQAKSQLYLIPSPSPLPPYATLWPVISRFYQQYGRNTWKIHDDLPNRPQESTTVGTYIWSRRWLGSHRHFERENFIFGCYRWPIAEYKKSHGDSSCGPIFLRGLSNMPSFGSKTGFKIT